MDPISADASEPDEVDNAEVRNVISGGVFFGAVIQGRYINVQLPPQVPTALSGLPAGSPGFSGRDKELAALLEVLNPDGSGPGPAIVLSGLAGVGKTELAVQAAHAAQNRDWYPGGVLFVDLYGYDETRRLEPSAALDSLLRALGIPAEHIPTDFQDQARLYSSALATFAEQGRRVLVVIDNAYSAEQARALLPATGAVVTSRHSIATLDARLLDLDALTPPDSVTLLERNLRLARPGDSRIVDSPEDAALVALLCGHLPLALRIVAALLARHPQQTLRQMAADLTDERTRLDELAAESWAVRAAFDLSYRNLEQEQARGFELIALSPGPYVATDAVIALTDGDPRTVVRMLAELAAAHLIEPAVVGDHWRMHDLVRLYAAEKSSGSGRKAREQAVSRLLGFYLRMAAAGDRHLRALPGVAVPAEFADREEALTWFDVERTTLIAAAAQAASTGRDRIASDLPNHMSEYLDWRRHFDDKIITESISRAAARRLRDRRREAAALNNLGIALIKVRRFEDAITACTEAAALLRKARYRQVRGNALNTLGIALRHVRRFDDAITAHQQAVEAFRVVRDGHSEAMALNNLGSDLREVRRFDEAITAHQRAVAVYRQAGDRHREGRALGNLGVVLREMRRFDEAVAASDAAGVLHRGAGDRDGEGDAMLNRGVALVEIARFEEAVAVLENAVAIYGEVGNLQREALARTDLGLALAGAGQLLLGIAAHEAAAATLREVGDRHGEGVAVNNLGAALRQAQRFDDAVAAHRQAASIFQETGDPRFEGAARTGAGAALSEAGRPEEAIAAYEAALVAFRRIGDRYAEGLTLSALTALRAAATEG